MANHQSAKKRSRQIIKRNKLNQPILKKVKSNIRKFTNIISSKDPEAIKKSWSSLNSSLARAASKGLIKKQHVARKLSSLSNQLKNIL